MDLTYRQIEIVHTVARHGSVTAAAEALGISQPAVSMMLRDSQSAVGFPLFSRRRGRLLPTAELSVILSEMDRVFQGVARIGQLVADIRDMTVGSVVVGATPTLADNMLPRAIAAFRRARPGIHVAVQTLDNPGVIEAVARDRVDFGLALTPLPALDAEIQPLGETEIVCAMPPDHALAGLAFVGLRDLAAHPLIGISRGQPLGDLMEAAFRAVGLERRLAIEVTQTSVALALVRAQAGVALVDPYSAAGGPMHGVVLKPVRPGIVVGAAALLPEGRAPSRAATWLLAAIRRAVARDL